MRTERNSNKHSKENAEKKEKDKKKHMEKFIFIQHRNWNMVVCIMIGIFKAIRSLYDLKWYKITPRDYELKYYFEIAPMYFFCRKKK